MWLRDALVVACSAARRRDALGQLIRENSDRRSLEIIELAAARRPNERCAGDGGQQQRQRQYQEQNRHQASLRVGGSKVRALNAEVTTVSEDSGIKSAASSGEM